MALAQVIARFALNAVRHTNSWSLVSLHYKPYLTRIAGEVNVSLYYLKTLGTNHTAKLIHTK